MGRVDLELSLTGCCLRCLTCALSLHETIIFIYSSHHPFVPFIKIHSRIYSDTNAAATPVKIAPKIYKNSKDLHRLVGSAIRSNRFVEVGIEC